MKRAVVWLLLAGCRQAVEPAPVATDVAAEADSEVAPAASDAPATTRRGPLDGGSVAEREAAVAALVVGGLLDQLPEQATDADREFDSELRGKLAPGARLRINQTAVAGALPPEVIQRIVRQSFGRFRLCFERAIEGGHEVHGHYKVEFTIDASGSVPMSSSQAQPPSLGQCLARSLRAMSFPQPEKGVVKVTLDLHHGD